MRKVLSAEEMREVDRLTTEKYGIPSILLMENAAHRVARVITEKLGGSVAGKSFLILCGKGNNGGDGAALARILWTLGADCFVYLFGKVEESEGDARINFEICKKISDSGETNAPNENCLFLTATENSAELIRIISESREKFIVEAFFGTGLSRPLDDNLQKIIEKLKSLRKLQSPPFVISIDIPSGLNADFAELIGENIEADLTVTFTAPKPANVLPPASNFNGELIVVNIGSPLELIDNSPSKLFLAEKEDAQNGFGKPSFRAIRIKTNAVTRFLIAGSREYSGAAVLAGNAAMLSGVGLTTIATGEAAQAAVAAKALEEVIVRGLPETESGLLSREAVKTIEKIIEKIDAVGIGCGLGTTRENPRASNRSKPLSNGENSEKAFNFVREIVESRRTPMVIDADGLNALAPFNLRGSDELPLILTPHEGEFLKLLGTKDRKVLTDRVSAARAFAEKYDVILVLKGERTLIAAPDGRVVINPTGNSGLGRAGNGDTLTGIIVGFVAQAAQMKIEIYETVVAAVFTAGLAGDIAAQKIGKRSMLATDVRGYLTEAFESINS